MGTNASGAEFILVFRQQGECFGETTLFDGLPVPYDHFAAGKTTLRHVPHAAALRLIESDSIVRNELVRIACLRLRTSSRYVELIIVPNLPARLAGHLLTFASEAPGGISPGHPGEVRLPQSAIAQLAGASREAVSRHLVEWRDAGWVSIGYRRLTILRPDALRAIANGSDAPSRVPRPVVES